MTCSCIHIVLPRASTGICCGSLATCFTAALQAPVAVERQRSLFVNVLRIRYPALASHLLVPAIPGDGLAC